MTDIIIIGAGPAGLTAAIYALRAEKSVLVIEKGVFGGQMTFSPKIENYPGFQSLSGNELADKMMEQALALGAEMEMDTVTSVEDGAGIKKVITENGEFEAKAVIIATGASHRLLGVEGEKELIGNGISFCAVCDGAFYNGGTVAVIGGGNSALQEALLLTENCKKVYIIQNLGFLTGEKKLEAALQSNSKVEIIYNTVVTGFKADTALKGVYLLNTQAQDKTVLDVDGVFVAIGLSPATAAFKGCVPLDEGGYIPCKEDCLTGKSGIFAAGDCRTKRIRQISTAAADGAVAALAACEYINSLG